MILMSGVMKTITVRGIDKITESALKKASQRLGKSINQTIITLLKDALGITKKERTRVYHDLDDLSGTWDAGQLKAFKKATEPFEQIEEELWQ